MILLRYLDYLDYRFNGALPFVSAIWMYAGLLLALPWFLSEDSILLGIALGAIGSHIAILCIYEWLRDNELSKKEQEEIKEMEELKKLKETLIGSIVRAPHRGISEGWFIQETLEDWVIHDIRKEGVTTQVIGQNGCDLKVWHLELLKEGAYRKTELIPHKHRITAKGLRILS